MTSEDADEFCAAMAKEIHQLEEKQKWDLINHEQVPADENVLPGNGI